MKLKKLELINFRNYNQLNLDFLKNIVCFTGLNGQGKTNIVEAVAVLGMLNSFRTNSYSDLIKFEKDHFFAKGVFLDNKNRTIDVRISYDGKKKKIMYQNKKVMRYSEMWGKIPVIYLIPDESVITNGPPAARREFTDKLLSIVDPGYFSVISKYNAIIKQKNKMLMMFKQTGSADADMLLVYNSEISELGAVIFKKRMKFIEVFLEYFKQIFSFISNGSYCGNIKYLTSMDIERYKESTIEKLAKYSYIEMKRGVSLVGPHRDDLEFLIGGKELKRFGSKGQHKLFLVSLKLAEIEYIKSITDEYPVFILDDLYSEIDEEKSLCVARMLDKDIQTFITTSNAKMISQLDKRAAQLYRVDNGSCMSI
ncbi:MAG: DNA replication and repair protein RecF [Candidatus Delongbacteria bacterium]